MKKFVLPLVFVLMLGAMDADAQMVTIPDPNFLIFLQNSDVAGCLTGNQLDASCPAVLSKTVLNCNSFNIADLTGLGAFVSLKYLYCGDNQLTFLPTLPNGLIFLDCQANQLTSLPGLPSGIIYLECESNQLTSLPSLPNGLPELYCNDNQLTSLPTLPSGLGWLHIHNNHLTSLPSLPSALTTLDCSWNYITSLPSLPSGLSGLYCGGNQLTFLPLLPSALGVLSCDDNQLTSLPSLPSGLTDLDCQHNQLSSLPSFPSGLTYLDCQYNQLDSLPSLPNALIQLFCNNNQLTSLPNLPSALTQLGCYFNQLTSLPTLPSGLTWLSCQYNQLTFLPSLPTGVTNLYCNNNLLVSLPNLPNTLVYLVCNNNQLTSLPLLPTTMGGLNVSNNPNLSCLPPLAHFTGWGDFNISNTGITCLPNVIEHYGTVFSIDNMPICGIFNPSGCEVAWNIKGTTYRDDNANCTADSAEPHIENVKLELLQNGNVQQQVYSNGVGDFSFDSNLGTYQTRVDTVSLPFNVSCPSTNLHPSTLIVTDSLDYAANFALQCKPGYDLAVQSIYQSYGIFFPAHQVTVNLQAGDLVKYYGVTCNTSGLSGTLTATVNGPISVTSASGNGVVSGNIVTWNVSDFSQLTFFDDFSVTMLVDNIPATNQLCVSASVSGSSGFDNHPSNNSLTQCFQVVNSFDPNYKEVYPQQITAPGQWLTYTVHFQNTGTAPAQNILVIDTLDSNLDWSTFQLLAYSHDNLTQVLNNGIVHFNFPNIGLPDSTTNESASHGWIQYRIKIKSIITPPTQIHNTASIYFDFNTPVVTNDASANFCVPTSVTQSLQICQGDSVHVGNHWYHQAGTYTDSLITSLGCDSVVTTTLAVAQPSSFAQTLNICTGDSVQVGSTWYHQSGTFTTTLSNTAGCDSTVTTTLNVSQPTFTNQSLSICSGDSVLINNVWQHQAGTFVNTYATSIGCDSTVTTIVALLQPSASLYEVTVCEGNGVLINGTWQTQPGTYTNHLTNAAGCDSAVITMLNVIPSSTQQILPFCHGDSVQVGSHWYWHTGIVHDTLSNILGCDSIITSILQELQPTAISQVITLCNGDSLAIGLHVYHHSGDYVDVLATSNGCDSTVHTALTIDTVDVTVHVHGDSAIAAAGMIHYHWFNCDNGQPVDTTQGITVWQSGMYAVALTDANGCTAQSPCVHITTGVNDVANAGFALYPNPSQNDVLVSYSPSLRNCIIVLTDLTGRTITRMILDGNAQTRLPLANVTSGSYYARIERDGKCIGVKPLIVIK